MSQFHFQVRKVKKKDPNTEIVLKTKLNVLKLQIYYIVSINSQ